MLLKNWYKALASVVSYTSGATSCVNVLGNKKPFLAYSTNNLAFGQKAGTNYSVSMREILNTYSKYYGGVYLGTGTKEVTIEDYALSGEMITNFIYNASVSSKEIDEGIEFTGLYTITNTGNESFTIGEIALVGFNNTGSDSEYKTMLERTVLDEPVTIPAGGIGQVTYTIRFNYPSA